MRRRGRRQAGVGGWKGEEKWGRRERRGV